MGCVNCGAEDLKAELYEGYQVCQSCLDEMPELDDTPYAPI